MPLHRFSRTERLITPEGIDRLASSHVIVFGIGGVGSHAAEALCRAGVGRITIVDYDDVCVSNINRQIHALDSTVGLPKVDVMARRMRDINPHADITGKRAFYAAGDPDGLLEGDFDVVLDCIDHFTSKADLLARCVQRPVPVVSSMGAAARLDPTKVRVDDISRTSVDPMARMVRKLLRKRGIERGITVVFSTERPQIPPGGAHRSGEGSSIPGVVDDRPLVHPRRVTLGSISYVPAIFGMTMAGVAVRMLLAKKSP